MTEIAAANAALFNGLPSDEASYGQVFFSARNIDLDLDELNI